MTENPDTGGEPQKEFNLPTASPGEVDSAHRDTDPRDSATPVNRSIPWFGRANTLSNKLAWAWKPIEVLVLLVTAILVVIQLYQNGIQLQQSRQSVEAAVSQLEFGNQQLRQNQEVVETTKLQLKQNEAVVETTRQQLLESNRIATVSNTLNLLSELESYQFETIYHDVKEWLLLNPSRLPDSGDEEADIRRKLNYILNRYSTVATYVESGSIVNGDVIAVTIGLRLPEFWENVRPRLEIQESHAFGNIDRLVKSVTEKP